MGFKSKSLNFLAEIREVTTMFMKWDSYNALDHSDLISLQELLKIAQTILFDHGAFIRQFLVDDKGCILIACWGVPTASYLDNAKRALRSGVDILNRFQEKDFECSFGITTGNVYCGNVGCEIRREYAAVGDVVNLAARLVSKAKHSILIDEATYSRLDNLDTSQLFEQLPPMTVKGKEKPINAFLFISRELPEATIAPKVVECEVKAACKEVMQEKLAKLEELRDAPSSTENVPLSVIFLEGKEVNAMQVAARWFKQEASRRSIKVVTIRMESKDMFIEYRMVSKLFWQILGCEAYEDISRQKMVVMKILHDIYGDNDEFIQGTVLPALKSNLGINFVQNETLFSSPGFVTLGAKVVREIIVKVMKALLSVEPMAVIVEAIHCSDEASMKVLTNLRDFHPKCLVLLTGLDLDTVVAQLQEKANITGIGGKGATRRSLMLSPKALLITSNAKSFMDSYRVFHKSITTSQSTTCITLDDFSVAEIDALLRVALNKRVLPRQLAPWVHQLSGGNVGWINEIIEYLTENMTAEEFITMVEDAMLESLISPKLPQKKNKSNSESQASSLITKRKSSNNKIDDEKSRSFFVASSPTSRNYSSNNSRKIQPETETSMSMVSNSNLATKSKLDLFIICRFEKLTVDQQQVLKKASIIGQTFSRHVLYGILPSSLKAVMYTSLQVLTKEHWIAESEDNEAEYTFCHALFRAVLYSLTPSGDRNLLHRVIAEYYESMNLDDPLYYAELCFHYSYANVYKAYEYAIKSVMYCMHIDLEVCISLLQDSLQFCNSLTDVKVAMKVREEVALELDETFGADENNSDDGLMDKPDQTDYSGGAKKLKNLSSSGRQASLHMKKSLSRKESLRMSSAVITTTSSNNYHSDGKNSSSFTQRLLSSLLCCYSASNHISNHVVAPMGSIHRTMGVTVDKDDHSLSMASKVSKMSGNSARSISTAKRNELVVLLDEIQKEIQRLLAHFSKECSAQEPELWQVHILSGAAFSNTSHNAGGGGGNRSVVSGRSMNSYYSSKSQFDFLEQVFKKT